MEYAICITEDCNQMCKFCFWNRHSNEKTLSKIAETEEIAKFIIDDKNMRGDEENLIVFYGGEPLLRQKRIKKIIEHTVNNDLKYAIYTNGILLHIIDPYILKNLSCIYVSIDGEHRIHDKLRGKGTFQSVVNNIFKIRQKFVGDIIGRLTITPISSLYNATLGTLNLVDHVYWQLESSPSLANLKSLKNKYEQELDNLFNYWTAHLEEGIIKNIIPFQVIAYSLISKEAQDGLRCGCGKSYVYIDMNGLCYSCDELTNNDKFKIGDIYNGVKYNGVDLYKDNNPYCKKCSVKSVCGGRCLKCFIDYPKEKFFFYCDCTKNLIQKVQDNLPLIQKLVNNGTIKSEDLNTYASQYYVEQIP